MILSTSPIALAGLLWARHAHAAYSIATTEDIKSSASLVAWDLVSYYHGNETGKTPGILPGPPPAGDYYWWEAGAMWGTLIDYWRVSGDNSYNKIITEALLFQVGPGKDYMPPNVTASLGNDDQGFWGMSAMLAAESGFPDPKPSEPQWLALAQAVFHTQADPDRHDLSCNGGLRWQIPLSNNGYNYKNSIANGCFFNLGARLARYLNNQTYADWAEKTWDWMTGVGLMDADHNVFDGAHTDFNCTDVNRAQFSYNNGIFLLGAAYMYNYTGEQKWADRVDKMVDSTIKVFFPDNIAYEPACEERMTCTVDMLSYKGYVHRWMSTAVQLAPFIREKVMATLQVSTEAAIATCKGDATGRTCGFKWSTKAYDGSKGAGQQMNVLGALSSLLIPDARAPFTNETGGTSRGDFTAGSQSDKFDGHTTPPTTADKAGAGILTIIVLGAAVGTFGWMSTGV